MIDGFLNGLGWVLAWCYSIIPSYGLAIIMLTVLVRIVLFPLTAKGSRSMIMMQRVQPEIKKLQAKYKNDRQTLNEETMKFYKENKISPFGGCLPLLAQAPVLFALYEVLLHVIDHIPTSSDLFKALCAPATTVAACKTPNVETLQFLGMNLNQSATNHTSSTSSVPYYILIALMVVTGFVQQQQSTRLQTNVNSQMQMVMKVLPVVFAVISINFPSGLVLYWVTSNVFQIVQQEWIYRTFGKKMMATPFVPVTAVSDVPADSKVVEKPKGFRAALRDAKEQAATPKNARSGNPANRPASGSGRVTPAKPPAKSKTGKGTNKSAGSNKDTAAGKGANKNAGKSQTPAKSSKPNTAAKEPTSGKPADETKAKRKRRR